MGVVVQVSGHSATEMSRGGEQTDKSQADWQEQRGQMDGERKNQQEHEDKGQIMSTNHQDLCEALIAFY